MNKVKVLEDLVKANVGAILVNDEMEKLVGNYAVVIDSVTEDENIMCRYDKHTGERIIPKWLEELRNNTENKMNVLLIKDIDDADDRMQLRFKEILKYQAINGEKIPENTVIFVSYKDNSKKINETISNLLIKY